MAVPPPALERAYGVTNIKPHIPIVLDADDYNYDAWRELFLTQCQSFDIAGHLDGILLPTNTTDVAWTKCNRLVKLWLYGTLTKDLFRNTFKTGAQLERSGSVLKTSFVTTRKLGLFNSITISGQRKLVI